MGRSLGAGVTPARNFLKTIGAGLLEEPDAMAGMLEFMDVRPDFGLPAVIVDGARPTRAAPGVQFLGHVKLAWRLRQFYENAADLFNVVIFPNHVFVPQKVAKAELTGLALGLGTGVERAIFGPELFG